MTRADRCPACCGPKATYVFLCARCTADIEAQAPGATQEQWSQAEKLSVLIDPPLALRSVLQASRAGFSAFALGPGIRFLTWLN